VSAASAANNQGTPVADEPLIAVFIDFENLALGVDQSKQEKFEIELVLKRLLQKGRIVFKRAYCDWSRYQRYVREFHANGIELVDIPQSKVSGKNSADIRMVVDALELCYMKEHLDTFALISGDSDFSPLVSKLKENDNRVIGCGVRRSSSELLISNCDEFIFYDDLQKTAERSSRRRKKTAAATTGAGQKKNEALDMLVSTVESLEEDYDPVWGSLVKQTMRRVYPGFTESTYGFKNFTDLLETASRDKRLVIQYDADRGNYTVRTASG
jgi:uncharacterized protein (TIGR00288 family)